MWSADTLGVLKIFSEEISGQNYFHNSKKQLFAFSNWVDIELTVQKQYSVMSKTAGLSQSLHRSVPKSGGEGVHLSVLDELVKSIDF